MDHGPAYSFTGGFLGLLIADFAVSAKLSKQKNWHRNWQALHGIVAAIASPTFALGPIPFVKRCSNAKMDLAMLANCRKNK